jgi:hypothetical protein
MARGRPPIRPVLPDIDDTSDDEERSSDGADVPAPFDIAPVARNRDVAPVPDSVLPVARVLAPLTLLETAFVRIGFTEHGARGLCSIDGENVTLEALTYMDNKVVKTLCQTMRKPGGGENGCVVATHAEMVLYLVCYMARHYQRTSRTMTVASIPLAEVESFSKCRTNEHGYKEPTEKM